MSTPHLRALLTAMLLMPFAADAVTLGQARVKSFLNQPLDAEIELVGLVPGQHEDLRLRLANQEHFDRLGIAYERYLTDIRFDVVRDGEKWLVRARSTQPLSEPFIDFPLQMSWPGGSMIRQYTLLLDPPRRIQPARTTVRGQRVADPEPAPQRLAPVASLASEPASYGPVRDGETLWPIAQKLKPGGITTRQMAIALLRANPAAFIDGNVNKLRAGATLEIPSRAFIEELDAAAARAEFAAQTRRWQAPVATSPRTLPTPAPVATAPTTAPTPPPEPPAPLPIAAEEAEDQLRIVTDKDDKELSSATERELKEQLLVTMEEIESNRITTGAIQSRLARLEAELDRMQQLVELKDAQIAALQSEISARQEIEGAAELAEPTAPVPATQTAPGSRPVDNVAGAALGPAASTLTRIDAAPPIPPQASGGIWYQQYLWVLWVVLALLGLTVITLMMRRPQPVPAETATAQLPAVEPPARPAQAPPTTFDDAEIRQAEADLRELASKPLPEPGMDGIAEEELPELKIPGQPTADDEIRGGVTDSLLDELQADEAKRADVADKTDKAADFTDDDIASWVAELGAEIDRADVRSANDEQLPLDQEIPGILDELDDRLTPDQNRNQSPPAPSPQPPAGTIAEDDAFNMSLDLARAYLEIGDQDGARDMLKQALAVARDPDHRRQIEELLQQIG